MSSARTLVASVLLLATFARAQDLKSPDGTAVTSSIPHETPDVSDMPAAGLAFGVYDPHATFEEENTVDIEHIFLYWQALDERLLERKMALAQSRQRALLVTVEPYTHAADWRAGGDKLFQQILDGGYDAEIRTICSRLGAFKGFLYIRWGHEMEDPDGRYPWARNDADGYKSSYRYFVNACRKTVPQARYVWSPKGQKNLADYYPGDAHVDIIGLPIWGLQQMDHDYWSRDRTFSEVLKEKYDLVREFRKPVMIAELGVSGNPAYRDSWLSQIFDEKTYQDRFELLRSVVFFVDEEPYPWPLGYGKPDWRVAHDTFQKYRKIARTVIDKGLERLHPKPKAPAQQLH